MSNAQDFVTSFMKNLAGEGVELTQALQAVFAKILAEQVVVDADTSVVSFKPAFSTLLKVLTFIATPEAERPEAGSSYTQEAIDTAADSAATETGLELGGDAPVDPELPTDEPTEEPVDPELPTDAPTEEPGVEGNTLELIKGTDVIAPLAEGEEAVEGVQYTTENNDTINGVVDSLSSKRTLDAKDVIDGGEGTDTLNVTLNANFSGFSTDGSLKNVEVVNLTNTGNFDRSFKATNVTGVETYNLNTEGKGGIKLTDLAEAGIAVGVTGLAQVKGSNDANLNIDFATKAVNGQNDSLTLNLNGVGRKNDAELGAADNSTKVTLLTNGIENLTLDAQSSYNHLDLNKSGTKTITVEGAAELRFNNVASTVTSVDASLATGSVAGNLAGISSQNLASLKGGAGNDTYTVNASGLKAISSLEGGAGDNKLTINADETSARSFKLGLNGFQTLAVTDSAAGKLTLSGQDTADLETLEYGRKLGNLVLADMQTEAFNIQLNDKSAGELTYDGFGELNIRTQEGRINATNPVTGELIANASETAKSSADVIAVNANTITFDVANNSTFSGALQAAVAETVTLNVGTALGNDKDGANKGKELTEFNGTLNATGAAQVNVNAAGKLGATATLNVDAAESLDMKVSQGKLTVNAKKATQVELNQAGDTGFTLEAGASTLNNVEVLNITASDKVTVDAALDKLASAEFKGTGQISFDQAIGKDAEQVDLNAQNLLGDFTVELADYIAPTGSTTKSGVVNIVGSNIGSNNITVGGSRDATVQGGISEDIIAIKANGEHTLTGGLGLDHFVLTAGGASESENTDGSDAEVSFTAESIDSAAAAGTADAEVMTITINGVDIAVTLRDAVTDPTDTASEVDASAVADAIAAAVSEAVAATDAGTNEPVNPALENVAAAAAAGVVTITLTASADAAGTGVALSTADYVTGTDTSFTWDGYKANTTEVKGSGAAIKGKVVITDFSLTDGDQLDLGTATGFKVEVATTTTVETVTSLNDALAGTSWNDVQEWAFKTTGGNTVFEFDGNTYVVVADSAAGFQADKDLLIELTGVTGIDTAALTTIGLAS